MMESDTTTLDNNVNIPIGGLSGLQSQRHENGSTFLCFDASTHPGWSCFYWKVWSWWLSFKSSRKWDSALNTRGHELWKLERYLSLTGTESLHNFCPCSKPTGSGCPWWNFPVVSVGGFARAGQAWRSGNHNRRVGGQCLGTPGSAYREVQAYVLAWNPLGVSLVLSVSRYTPHAKEQRLLTNHCPCKGAFNCYLVTKKSHSDLNALWIN